MRNLSICLALIVLGAGSVKADDTLGTADSFAVLAGSTVTNYGAGILGATVITGNLGVSPGPTCIGFVGCSTTGPGTVSGTIDLANGAAGSAMGNLNTAYTTLLGLSVGPHVTTVPGGILTGTYAPGVYIVSAPPSNLTGTIYLNDGDVAGSQFVFVMTSTLTTSSNSVVDVTGLSPGDSVFWVVESSATLGNNTAFEGNILANTSITFNPGATDLCGRALGGAVTASGAVSFDGQGTNSPYTQNQVSIACSGNLAGSNGLGGGASTSTPEPGTLSLLALGFAGIAFLSSKRRRVGSREMG
jgi:hypothetical protein